MLTIGAGASADYYVQSTRVGKNPSDYWHAGKEPPGKWWNPEGLFGLPDGKQVREAHFRRLYNGFEPHGAAKLTRTAGSPNRSAIKDLTFSADKSVSVLWALAVPETRTQIENAVDAAVRTALDTLIREYCSYTRIRDANKQIAVIPGRILGATWMHGESRELDPQLHVHATIFNLALAEDQRWRAHHQYPLFKVAAATSAAFRVALADELTSKLGLKIERHGKHGFIRIAGMPEDLLRQFSKRTAEIEEAASRIGVAPSFNPSSDRLSINTRANKQTEPASRQADHQRWRTEAEQLHHVETLLTAILDTHEDPDELRICPAEKAQLIDRMIAEIPDTLTETKAVFSRTDLLRAVMEASAARISFDEALEVAERIAADARIVATDMRESSADGHARLPHTELFTTRTTVRTELEIRDLATALSLEERQPIDRQSIARRISALQDQGTPLSLEQRHALDAAAGTAAVTIVEGAAGSGKSTTLRPVADLFRASGHDIHAIAVAWRTARALGKDISTPGRAVAKFLFDIERGTTTLGPKSVIIVDEAGQIPSALVHRLLTLTRSSGARMILVGDTSQQQPVGAGPGLRLVRDVVSSTRIDTIRRQQMTDEDYVAAAHGLPVAQARAWYRSLPEPDRETLLRNARTADTTGHVPWMVGASGNLRDRNSTQALLAYDDAGAIHIESTGDAAMSALIREWAATRKHTPERTTLIQARTNAEAAELSLRARDVLLSHVPDKDRHVIDLSGSPRRSELLEIAVGDQLRIRTTVRAHGLVNGSILTVDAVARTGAGAHQRTLISATTETGRTVSFHADEVRDRQGRIRIEYAYASTITSAQGLTVDHSFLFVHPYISHEEIYSAMTRHRHGMRIFANGAEIDTMIRDAEAVADPTTKITHSQRIDTLARSWRSRPERAATDYLSRDQIDEFSDRPPHTPGLVTQPPRRQTFRTRVRERLQSRWQRQRWGATARQLARDIETITHMEQSLATKAAASATPDQAALVARWASMRTAAAPILSSPHDYRHALAHAGLTPALVRRWNERWRDREAADRAASLRQRARHVAPQLRSAEQVYLLTKVPEFAAPTTVNELTERARTEHHHIQWTREQGWDAATALHTERLNRLRDIRDAWRPEIDHIAKHTDAERYDRNTPARLGTWLERERAALAAISGQTWPRAAAWHQERIRLLRTWAEDHHRNGTLPSHLEALFIEPAIQSGTERHTREDRYTETPPQWIDAEIPLDSYLDDIHLDADEHEHFDSTGADERSHGPEPGPAEPKRPVIEADWPLPFPPPEIILEPNPLPADFTAEQYRLWIGFMAEQHTRTPAPTDPDVLETMREYLVASCHQARDLGYHDVLTDPAIAAWRQIHDPDYAHSPDATRAPMPAAITPPTDWPHSFPPPEIRAGAHPLPPDFSADQYRAWFAWLTGQHSNALDAGEPVRATSIRDYILHCWRQALVTEHADVTREPAFRAWLRAHHPSPHHSESEILTHHRQRITL